MATFIEVQTTDVNGLPVKAGPVEIAIDGSGTFIRLQPVSSGGVQAEITGAKQIELHVTAPGNWDVTQHFKFTDGDPPEVEPDQATYNPYDYEINLDPPVIHTASNNDWIMTIHVRMSHLRDAKTKVQQVLKDSHDSGWAQKFDTEMDFDLNRSVTTRLVGKWILGDQGAVGPDRLNTTTANGPPGGRLFFLERTKTPRLVLVWIPENADVIGKWYEEMPVPLHYQLFFHPAIPWSDHPKGEEAYPWNFDSLNLPHRYLMGRPPHPNDPEPDQFGILYGTNKNKHMLNMIKESGAGVIFVFPVGSGKDWLTDITNQSSALLLLQEINHFVQRRAASEIALHPIGRIAVSGFSFGYSGPAFLASSPPVAGFDEKWDEIYNFDGNEAWFVAPTRAWFNRRPDKRRLRIYVQPETWDTIAAMFPFNKAVKVIRFSASETESYGGTVLKAPGAFWNGAFGVSDFFAIHQTIPALFLHHAMQGWFYI